MNEREGLKLETYEDLYKWSVQDIDKFWDCVWDETGVIGTKSGGPVSSVHDTSCPRSLEFTLHQ